MSTLTIDTVSESEHGFGGVRKILMTGSHFFSVILEGKCVESKVRPKPIFYTLKLSTNIAIQV